MTKSVVVPTHGEEQWLSSIKNKGGADSSPTESPAPRALIVRPSRGRTEDIGKRFNEGESLADIAASHGITRETVLRHLQRFINDGAKIDPTQLLKGSTLSSSSQQAVLHLFEKLGLSRLGPVHKALGGTVPYSELHLLRLYAQAMKTHTEVHPQEGRGCGVASVLRGQKWRRAAALQEVARGWLCGY